MHSHSTLSVIGASSYPLISYPLRASSSLRPRSLHHRSFFHRRRSLHRSVHDLITDSNGHSLEVQRLESSLVRFSSSETNSAVKNAIPYYSTRKKPSTLKNERENMKDQLDLRYSSKNQSEVEVETEPGILDESINAVEIDPVSKIQSSLDSSLAKATKTNNIHEGQLNRSQGHANGSIKSMGEGELVTKEKFERIKSMLEAELSDIQERYFHMSLKYAEVEAERLFHNLRKEVNGLRIGLEMRIAQLENEKSSLLQKEENLLEKINLLESDLSSFVENEALAALVLKTGVTIQQRAERLFFTKHSPESCEECWDDEEEAVAAERASEVNFTDEISGINTGSPSPTSSNESSITS
ncbi:hypothetical protein Ahy_B05g078143 isoform F [Arachis hypogaea]|uniref:Uncharacterized protein n=2 Tax=Arachis hypogaea TaxID=3818 RepID=A0A444Z6E2_ARAHY|nr:hypothetical protein Ahy_B05g078143 isoform F [Arachis hypogaea]